MSQAGLTKSFPLRRSFEKFDLSRSSAIREIRELKCVQKLLSEPATDEQLSPTLEESLHFVNCVARANTHEARRRQERKFAPALLESDNCVVSFGVVIY